MLNRYGRIAIVLPTSRINATTFLGIIVVRWFVNFGILSELLAYADIQFVA